MAKGIKTGGRGKGTPNKATADVKAIARQYAPIAIAELARLAKKAKSEQARVSACREILDRACGKAAQPVAVTGENGGPIVTATIDASKLNEDQLRTIASIQLNER